jgi:hypothetical protein
VEILPSGEPKILSLQQLTQTVIIPPWINMIAGQLGKGDCAISMTDSLTSEGWLWKMNFIEERKNPIQVTI